MSDFAVDWSQIPYDLWPLHPPPSSSDHGYGHQASLPGTIRGLEPQDSNLNFLERHGYSRSSYMPLDDLDFNSPHSFPMPTTAFPSRLTPVAPLASAPLGDGFDHHQFTVTHLAQSAAYNAAATQCYPDLGHGYAEPTGYPTSATPQLTDLAYGYADPVSYEAVAPQEFLDTGHSHYNELEPKYIQLGIIPQRPAIQLPSLPHTAIAHPALVGTSSGSGQSFPSSSGPLRHQRTKPRKKREHPPRSETKKNESLLKAISKKIPDNDWRAFFDTQGHLPLSQIFAPSSITCPFPPLASQQSPAHSGPCGETLSDWTQMRQHLREHGLIKPHTNTGKEVVCPYPTCHEPLRGSSFTRHVLNHLGTFICKEDGCGHMVANPRKDLLKKHYGKVHKKVVKFSEIKESDVFILRAPHPKTSFQESPAPLIFPMQ